ncbi:PREDICTED: uncharacterized protein LOC104619397 [Phaethon lepturus]|uniref:uncharacterized protein LOC104619397 n=1 Tax=Phaethon lepturus TaxID=97097 RepID=UPI0005306706|nr:PREDICTED: uncharacterized protein LOC104619397 [Phaethon lepturus]
MQSWCKAILHTAWRAGAEVCGRQPRSGSSLPIAVTFQLQSSPAAPTPVPARRAPSPQLASASGFAAAAYLLVLLVGARSPFEQQLRDVVAAIFKRRWAASDNTLPPCPQSVDQASPEPDFISIGTLTEEVSIRHILQIEESSKPVRLSQQLDKAVTTNYKPVANHQYNIEYEKKKKEDGKRARADKQQVLDMLFSAFEKHQYYNIKDLVDITKQPVIYLKEILREIGIYNVKGTHKNTWELKPEYRHYQTEDKSD